MSATNNSAGSINVQVTVQGIEQLKSQLMGTSQAFRGFGSGVQGADAVTKQFEGSAKRLQTSVQGTSLGLRSMVSDMSTSGSTIKASATSMHQLATDSEKASGSLKDTGEKAAGATKSMAGMIVPIVGFTQGVTEAIGMTQSLQDQQSKIADLQLEYNEAVAEYGEESKEAARVSGELEQAQRGLQFIQRSTIQSWGDLTSYLSLFGLQAYRAIKDAGGMGNVFGKLTGILGGAKTAMESVGTAAVSGIAPLSNHFSNISFNAHGASKSVEGLKRGIVFSGALASIGGVSGSMSALTTATEGATTAVTGMGRAMRVALIASGVGAAIAGGIALLEAFTHNWFGLRDAVNGAGKAIGDFLPFLRPVLDGLSGIGDLITKTFGGSIPEAAAQTSESLAEVGESAKLTAEDFETLEKLSEQSTESMAKHIETIRERINSNFDKVTEGANSLIEKLASAFTEGKGKLNDAIDELEESVKTNLTKGFENMLENAAATQDWKKQAENVLTTIKAGLTQAFTPSTFNELKKNGEAMIDSLREGLDEMTPNARARAEYAISEITKALNSFQDPEDFKIHMGNAVSLVEGIGRTASDQATPLGGLGKNIDNLAGNANTLATSAGTASESVKGVGTAAVQQMGPLQNFADTIQRALIDPIVNFGKSLGPAISQIGFFWGTALPNQISGFLTGKAEEFKNWFNSLGPMIQAESQKGATAFANFINGLGVAAGGLTTLITTKIQAGIGALTAKGKEIADAIWGGISTTIRGANEIWSMVGAKLGSIPVTIQRLGLSIWSYVQTGIGNVWEPIASKIGGIPGQISTIGSKIWTSVINGINSGTGTILSALSAKLGDIGSFFTQVGHDIWKSITGAFSGGGGKGEWEDFQKGGFLPPGSGTPTIDNSPESIHKGSFGGGGGQLGSELSGLKILAQAASLAVQKEISAMVVAVQGMVKMMADSARASFVQIGTDIVGLSKGIVAFSQGVAKTIPETGTYFQTMANSARTAMVQIGQDIVGLSRGVVAFSTGIAQTATRIGQSFTTMANGARAGMVQMGQDIIGLSKGIVAFRDGVVRTAQTISSSVQRMASSFGSSMSQLIARANAAASAVRSLQSAINSLRSKSITITVTTRYRTVGSPTRYSAGSVSASSLEMPAQQAGFGLASVGGTNNSAMGPGSQQLTLPSRVVVEATIPVHIELGGREILKYVNKNLLENASVHIY